MEVMTYAVSLSLALTFLATSAAANQRGRQFEDVGRNDVIFNDDLLFETPVRSMMDCASRCTLDAKCLTFTYAKGKCWGHPSPVTSLTSTTSQLGASTFVKSESVVYSQPQAFVLVTRSPSDNLTQDLHQGVRKNVIPPDQDLTTRLKATDSEAESSSELSTPSISQTTPNDVEVETEKPKVCSAMEGVWTVIQRRDVGDVSFQRDFNDYVIGFGSYCGDFWLGLDKIHTRTESGQWQLAVEVESWEGERFVALYSNFSVGSRKTDYTLLAAHGFNRGSPAGDGLQCHEGQPFSTRDHGETSLAIVGDTYSGWWFNSNCFGSNLNGCFYTTDTAPARGGITWTTFRNATYSLKSVKMQVAPAC